jgi:hypothetical protein
MNRAGTQLAAVTLALMLGAAVGAGPALADDPPAPVTGQATANGTGSYDPTADPAVPYIVALLVTSAGLMVVGLLAMQQQRAGSRRRAARPDGWACAACGMGNTRDRASCFSCHAPREAAFAPPDGAIGAGPAHAPDPSAEGYSA